MNADQLTSLIAHLGSARTRPGMYFGKLDVEAARHFLDGFGIAVGALFGFHSAGEAREEAFKRRGWRRSGRHPSCEMMERGMSAAQVIDELLLIEIEALRCQFGGSAGTTGGDRPEGDSDSPADKRERYREIVSRVVEEYARYKPSHGKIDTEVIADRTKDHYEVMHVGWDGVRRVHGSVVHLDIIDGKVWIQYDGTNRPVAEELMAAGIPREDIVLAFHPPDVRRFTDFAVG